MLNSIGVNESDRPDLVFGYVTPYLSLDFLNEMLQSTKYPLIG